LWFQYVDLQNTGSAEPFPVEITLYRGMFFVVDTLEQCPAEVELVAEAYCIGTLPLSETAAFEDHYIACKRCATVVEDTDTYVRVMQDAARKLRAIDQKARAVSQC
jgi:hypothetical protein